MDFWEMILQKLKTNQSLYLLTVIENFGSSPGRQGFKMVVAKDGWMNGSIGGGVMEFNIVELAKNLLQEATAPIFLKRQIHRGSKVDGSGMICSGEQTIVFHPLNQNHLTLVQTIIETLENQQKGILHLSSHEIKFETEKQTVQYMHKIKSKEEWFFKEQLNYKECIYIIGAGHVGLATSKLFSELGYEVHIFDNRPNLNTFEQNKTAHHKYIVDYENIANCIPNNESVYIAIMTHNFKDDRLALTKLIRKKYKFLGVLGSKAKLKTMFDVLQKKGFTEAELSKIHAPIGLPIYSQTPYEIAVSIAAQIIQIKNKL